MQSKYDFSTWGARSEPWPLDDQVLTWSTLCHIQFHSTVVTLWLHSIPLWLHSIPLWLHSISGACHSLFNTVIVLSSFPCSLFALLWVLIIASMLQVCHVVNPWAQFCDGQLSVYLMAAFLYFTMSHGMLALCFSFPPSQIFFWSEAMEFVISVAGAVIFCGFIIFDTHLIMHKLSPEEYILASVNLYLDFLNLFLYVLRILQAMRREWTNTQPLNSSICTVVMCMCSLQIPVFVYRCTCLSALKVYKMVQYCKPKNLLNTNRSSSQGRNW